MQLPLRWLCVIALLTALCPVASGGVPVTLFDGATLAGWEGATGSVWRVEQGAILGGSLAGNPRNEFLATTRAYTNFVLQFEYRLQGTEGFVNGGVQFRSRRIPNPPNEMSGFQADIGAGYSGSLYDESRRNRMLALADKRLIERIEKPGEWNRYVVEARGPQIVLSLNGQRTATWVEKDPSIEDNGVIALQIHGDCKAVIAFRNISIEELPSPVVPPGDEVLSRFGSGQPVLALPGFSEGRFTLDTNEVIVFTGQENFVREQKRGELEAFLSAGFVSQKPRFRSMAWEADTVYEQWRDLNFGSWTAQLEKAGATVVIAQFGQLEALDGPNRIPEFVAAYHRLLDQFALRTRKLVLISPMPFETPLAPHAPDLQRRNEDVRSYALAVKEIARQRGAVFVNLFDVIAQRQGDKPRLTEDGIHLTDRGLVEVGRIIAGALGVEVSSLDRQASLREAIVRKNELWFDCWRPANWSFVYGDRVAQAFARGAGEEPHLKIAFQKNLPLIAEQENRIHALASGTMPPVAPVTAAVSPQPDAGALSPEEQLATLKPAEGFAVGLFASELQGVVKPIQIAWDETGRMYVACSPAYPHSRASAPRPDYILVLEDTDQDGRADRSWKFAEGLTMVQGVEPGAGGVYVCDFDQVVHFTDSDGDGRADTRKVVLSGFGVGDTHQLVNSITYGPDGSLWFTQGLHAFSRVETPWGIARLDRSAVWRLRPGSIRLDGFFGGGMAGANCWGVAFDDYGQVFHKSGDRPHGYWTVPGMVRGGSAIGSGSVASADVSYAQSPEQYHSVGPLFDTSPKTTAIDIIGTQAMPEELQGCAVIGGYFGGVVEVHRFSDAGAGFKTTQLPRVLTSSSNAFRPVDVGVGPDGAIYAADWFNPVIGHYQASYADPMRDRSRGRIWRVSAKGRPSIKQPDLKRMDVRQLLEQLKSPERWTRQQAKRRLFHLPASEVVTSTLAWVRSVDVESPDHGRWLIDAAGVLEAHESPDADLLKRLVHAKDPRVRAYGARVAGAWGDRLPAAKQLLLEKASDPHPRVRLETAVAATYIPHKDSVNVVTRVLDSAMDPFLTYAVRASARALQPFWGPELAAGRLETKAGSTHETYLRKLLGEASTKRAVGEEVYEMACLPCHQPGGRGLAGVYPALAGSDWVIGDPRVLTKIILHGLEGPIQSRGRTLDGTGTIPMPSMAGLTDEQIADVLTFVRSSFGKNATPVRSSDVTRIRNETSERQKPWTQPELESLFPEARR